MVGEYPDDPGLDVVASQVYEERPLDVNVPELVRPAAFVTRSGRAGNRTAAAAKGPEQVVDVVWTHLVDSAPTHLGCNALRVPVGVQPDGDDDHVDPAGAGAASPPRSHPFAHQP